ncbi:MAG: hypothetical protein ACREPV_12165 [Lysobacter sp.]
MPGTFIVKASQNPFIAGESRAARLDALPDSKLKLDNWIEVNHRDADGQPFAGQGYTIFFEGGQTIKGKLDADGHARHESVPEKAERVEYEPREPLDDEPWKAIGLIAQAARSKLG